MNLNSYFFERDAYPYPDKYDENYRNLDDADETTFYEDYGNLLSYLESIGKLPEWH
jgi:hypothetical protein